MQPLPELPPLDGGLLINKPAGISSFGVIEQLQRQLCARYGVKRSKLPKLGHGGTLDPFATGLMIVCVGKGVKLARYFLGSGKTYEGVIRFGETTIPGDPTAPISETVEKVPGSIEEVRTVAQQLTRQGYLQTPPMHSAKKKDGKPLYELAREGIEIEREPKLCQLHRFDILDYSLSGDGPSRARFHVECSSGTYIRVLAQDLAKMLGTVGMLDSLHRTASGSFRIENALTLDQLAATAIPWDELPGWIPFDRLLEKFPRALATREEARSISQGKQHVLFNILKRTDPLPDSNGDNEAPRVVIYDGNRLLAIACREEQTWCLERVFPVNEG